MLADNWLIFLGLTICSIIVLLELAIVQELWLILTGEREGYSPLDDD